MKRKDAQTYIWIPERIYRKRNLSAMAKLLWGYLRLRLGKNDKCWPSEDRMADDLGTTPPTIRLAIDKLEAAGEYQIERSRGGPGRSNHYRPGKQADQIGKESCAKRGKNLSPNNNNNTYYNLLLELSDEQRSAYTLLTDVGVRPRVATSLACQHPLTTIEQVVAGSLSAEKKADGAGRGFNLPGYIVAGLNRIRSGGKVNLGRVFTREEDSSAKERNEKLIEQFRRGKGPLAEGDSSTRAPPE